MLTVSITAMLLGTCCSYAAETKTAEETAEAAVEEAGEAAVEEAGEASEATCVFQQEQTIGGILDKSDKENVKTIDEKDALKVLEPESEEVSGRGLTTSTGRLEEYKMYRTASAPGMDEYFLFYIDPSTRVITCLADIVDLGKAYYPESYVTNLNLNDIIPGYSQLSFAESYLVDYGDFYRLLICFDFLDNSSNVSQLAATGVVTVEGSGLLNADLTAAKMIMSGAVELSDFEISQLGINP